jgi:hypothetical protein
MRLHRIAGRSISRWAATLLRQKIVNVTNCNSDMTTKIEKERWAQDAINKFVQQSCGFLVPGEEGRIAPEVGTGTIVRTKGGHYCILTARHIAEDALKKEYRLGFLGCTNPISNFVGGVLMFADDTDIGLLIVKDELATPLRNLALTQDSVSAKEQEGIVAEDTIVLTGYPAQISHYYKKESLQDIELITYWCSPEAISLDKSGRYQLEWKDAVPWRRNGTFDLPAPKGMSGGPLWRFRKPASSSIWSASNIGKIVAVQTAWNWKDTLFLEPVETWSDWFHESLSTIDKTWKCDSKMKP